MASPNIGFFTHQDAWPSFVIHSDYKDF